MLLTKTTVKIQKHTDEVISFVSFGVDYTPKEIIEKIEHSSFGNKNIKTSIFRIQDYN